MVLDLRTVEGALAGQFFPGHVAGGKRRTQGVLGAIPGLVGSQTLRRAQRQLHRDIREAEVTIHGHGLLVEGGHLGLDLLFGTEDVAVILREAPNPHDAVQRTRRLVAVA